MSKQTQALKLAQDLRALADRFSEGWHEGIKIDALDIELLANAAEALAEQPAQKQEPDYHICPTCGGMTSDPIVPPADRFASKPWVGLTDDEIEAAASIAFYGYMTDKNDDQDQAFARAIEAKLREKNA